MHHRHQSEQGASLVEFALAIPVVLLTLYAIIYFGIFLSAKSLIHAGMQRGLSRASVLDDIESEDATKNAAARAATVAHARELPESSLVGPGRFAEIVDMQLKLPDDLGDPYWNPSPPVPLPARKEGLAEYPMSMVAKVRFQSPVPLFGGFEYQIRAVGYREPRFNSAIPRAMNCLGRPVGSEPSEPSPTDCANLNTCQSLGIPTPPTCDATSQQPDAAHCDCDCKPPFTVDKGDHCECAACPPSYTLNPSTCRCNCTASCPNANYTQNPDCSCTCSLSCVPPRVPNAACAGCVCPADPTCVFPRFMDGSCNCRCFGGKVWDGSNCACPTCPPGQITINPFTCACGCAVPPACGPGARLSADRCSCVCNNVRHTLQADNSCVCVPSACPAGKHFDMGSCSCVCDLVPADCGTAVYNGTSCSCDCPAGKVFDSGSKTCVCPAAPCPGAQVRDASCNCHCPNGCTNGGVQDPGTCACTCPPGKAYNPASGACECSITCGAPKTNQDPSTCACSCPNVCSGAQNVQNADCSCSCPANPCTSRGWALDGACNCVCDCSAWPSTVPRSLNPADPCECIFSAGG